MARRQISRQRQFDAIPEWNVAFFLSFAADQNGLSAQANVIEINADELGIADAASVKQFEHQAVALRERGDLGHVAIEHRIHFFQGGHARQFLRKPGSRHQCRRILLDHPFLREPAIQRSNGGKGTRNGGLAETLIVEMGKKSANGDVVYLGPVARPDVRGKVPQISRVGLNRVHRRIAFAQRAQEFLDCDYYSFLTHHKPALPQRHRITGKPRNKTKDSCFPAVSASNDVCSQHRFITEERHGTTEKKKSSGFPCVSVSLW